MVRRVDVLKLCFANLATISNMYPFKAYLLQEKRDHFICLILVQISNISKQATPIQINILVFFFQIWKYLVKLLRDQNYTGLDPNTSSIRWPSVDKKEVYTYLYIIWYMQKSVGDLNFRFGIKTTDPGQWIQSMTEAISIIH